MPGRAPESADNVLVRTEARWRARVAKGQVDHSLRSRETESKVGSDRQIGVPAVSS